MPRIFACIATLLACAGVHAADKDNPSAEEKARLQAAIDYVKAYPRKMVYVDDTGSGRVQMYAEAGITIVSGGKVIVVDATQGPPHTLWGFRGPATEIKCEFIDHPEQTREAEISAVLKSFANADDDTRALAPHIARKYLSHLRCVADHPLITEPSFSMMSTTSEFLAAYNSPNWTGPALFLTQYNGSSFEILSVGLPPPAAAEKK